MASRVYYCNTSAFPHHRLADALALLVELGYDGVSLTLDVGHADLADPAFDPGACARLLGQFPLGVTIETGGRYVLDPRRKHRPSLLDAGDDGLRRLDFYRRAVDLAAEVGAPLVSVWSGTLPEDTTPEAALRRLEQRLPDLLAHAAAAGVRIALEPEPGMLVDTLAAYEALRQGLPDGQLWLTCDLGHLYCSESPPYPELLRRHADRLINVHVDDIAGGRHEHLELGQGDIDFPPLLATLDAIEYQGPLSVELSRSGHRAPLAVAAALEFLRALERPGT
jgi:sugar phosphate isomerase/epimerase